MREDLLAAYRWYGRFIGVAVFLYSGFLLIVNVAELIARTGAYEGWVLAWIFGSGFAGVIGAAAFMVSIDGPDRARTRSYRLGGWVLMVAAVMLPSSISFFLLPMTIVAVGLAIRRPELRSS